MERHLAEVARLHALDPVNYPAYAVCELGKYKPYSYPVIAAAKRRGYQVMRFRGLYHVYLNS